MPNWRTRTQDGATLAVLGYLQRPVLAPDDREVERLVGPAGLSLRVARASLLRCRPKPHPVDRVPIRTARPGSCPKAHPLIRARQSFPRWMRSPYPRTIPLALPTQRPVGETKSAEMPSLLVQYNRPLGVTGQLARREFVLGLSVRAARGVTFGDYLRRLPRL